MELDFNSGFEKSPAQQDMEVYAMALKHCQIELAEAETDEERQEIRKAIADCRWAIAAAYERETVLINESRIGGQSLEV